MDMPCTLEKSAAGRKKGQEERTEQERITQLDLEQKSGFRLHFLAKKQDKNKSCVHQSLKEGLN